MVHMCCDNILWLLLLLLLLMLRHPTKDVRYAETQNPTMPSL